VKNVAQILAIELLITVQALEQRGIASSPAVENMKAALRQVVPPLDEDRILYPDLNSALQLIDSQTLLQAVQAARIELY